jgi:hypothetical protein
MVVKAELKVKIEGIRALREAVRKATSRSLRDIADMILTDSQARVPVGATTALKDSGQLRPEVPVTSGEYAWIEVVYDAPYAAFVHEGTKPHFPPVDALVRWVQLVLGIHDEKEARGVAFAIARTISIHGTKPEPFLKDALNATKGKWQRILEKNFKDQLDPLSRYG